MTYLKELEGEQAILQEGGVFKPSPLYTRDGQLFAKAAGGFVRLAADGSTSKVSGRLRFTTLVMSSPLYRNPMGRLAVCQWHLKFPQKGQVKFPQSVVSVVSRIDDFIIPFRVLVVGPCALAGVAE
jgi:hypothetical protein